MKQFSMWAVLAFAVFLIGKSAQSANEQMSMVLLLHTLLMVIYL